MAIISRPKADVIRCQPVNSPTCTAMGNSYCEITGISVLATQLNNADNLSMCIGRLLSPSGHLYGCIPYSYSLPQPEGLCCAILGHCPRHMYVIHVAQKKILGDKSPTGKFCREFVVSSTISPILGKSVFGGILKPTILPCSTAIKTGQSAHPRIFIKSRDIIPRLQCVFLHQSIRRRQFHLQRRHLFSSLV